MCVDTEIAEIKPLLDLFTLNIAQRLKELSLRPNKSFWFFFPRPSSGSACKRLNLYLRWMIGSGPFDFNIWKGICESRLMIPLDVHLLKQARSLKLTRRKQADWKTVEEVTNKLRLLDGARPVRFDFALCHLGINGKILASLLMFFLVSCSSAPHPEDSIKNAPILVKKTQFTQQDEARFLRAIKDDDVNQVHFFISMGINLNKNFSFPGMAKRQLCRQQLKRGVEILFVCCWIREQNLMHFRIPIIQN